MRYRWKLLILLLIIALAPIIGMRLGYVHNVRLFSEQIVTRAAERLNADMENRMREMVAAYSALIGANRDRLEEVIDYQVLEIERLLSLENPGASTIHFSEDFDRPAEGPFEFTTTELHFRPQPDGSDQPLPITYDALVFSIAPGVEESAVLPKAERLAPLADFYRRSAPADKDLILWFYISFSNGLHAAFPGHGAVPCELDARLQPWYRPAAGEGRPRWSLPYIDPETRQVVTALSRPLHDKKGRFVGVTAMVVPLARIISIGTPTTSMPAGTLVFLSTSHRSEETGREGIMNIASAKYEDLRHRNWRSRLDLDWLTSSDEAQLAAMRRDLDAGRSGARRMPYKGRDSLWAYGPALYESKDNNAFLVMITPYDRILAPAREIEAFINNLLEGLLALSRTAISVVTILVFVLAFIFSRTVTKPLQSLVAGVQRLARGDFDAKADIRTRDEFGEVGRAFNQMGGRLKEHYRITQALAVAREVQRNLLPKARPGFPGLDIAGESLYCDQTGGDYFDFLESGEKPPSRISVVVGDVSGHGIQSALLMASARAFLRQRSAMAGSLAEMIRDVNRQLARDVEETGQFMTLFFCRLDLKEKLFSWVRAGHEPALLFDPVRDTFEELGGRGAALGLTEEMDYEENTRSLLPGRIYLLGTDGIWEAHNAQGRMFGKAAFREIVRANRNSSAQDILRAVVLAVREFQGHLPQEDDLTLVVIKVEH